MLHGTTPWTVDTPTKLIHNIINIPFQIKRTDLKPDTLDFIKKCL